MNIERHLFGQHSKLLDSIGGEPLGGSGFEAEQPEADFAASSSEGQSSVEAHE